jgi:hypothetical protein
VPRLCRFGWDRQAVVKRQVGLEYVDVFAAPARFRRSHVAAPAMARPTTARHTPNGASPPLRALPVLLPRFSKNKVSEPIKSL